MLINIKGFFLFWSFTSRGVTTLEAGDIMSKKLKDGNYTYDELQKQIGRLIVIPRRDKITLINGLSHNASPNDRLLFQKSYGIFLSLMRKTVPLKPMVDFLIPLTDSTVITQGRVDLCCDIFTQHTNSVSIARLLQKMRETADMDIYIPPLGSDDVVNANIPISVMNALTPNILDQSMVPEATNNKASKISLSIYQELSIKHRSDADTAFVLAEYLPLVWHSGRVLPGIEAWAEEYLNHIWGPKYNFESTNCLELLASQFFRFWDRSRSDQVKSRLIVPLLNAKKSAARVLIPHVWYLGEEAFDLINQLAELVRPTTVDLRLNPQRNSFEALYMHIYQFYYIFEESSREIMKMPSFLLTDLILKFKIYLFLCNRWANESTPIGETLQGRFSLDVTEEGNEILLKVFEDHLNIMYCLANSAWLGEVPQLIYAHFKSIRRGGIQSDSSTPVLITPQTLSEDLGLSYFDFCMEVVEFLRKTGTPITHFLIPQ